uniref:Uncharacterized protein n=1 Tax=Ditylenchus dipsaci TaxID=166011 RepID=A0A915D0F1_9BILA
MVFISVAMIITVWLASTYFFLLELPLDPAVAANCEASGCLFIKYKTRPQLYFKISISMSNLLCSLYFFYLVKKASSLI